MADAPPNRTRIVPIMARRKTSAKNPPSEAHTIPVQRQLRTRAAKEKAAEHELLRLSCLDTLGLYALPTKGDGNCLYYALSDQMYGVWDRFAEIRMRLAGHMRAHRDYFINFTAAVGGERRAPRRAAAAASRSSVGFVGPAAKPEDQQQKFEAKVADSEKNRVWGGSEEIQAFCQSYKRDVRVYTNSGIQTFRDVYAPHQEERDVVHIAFHNFDHYSSVRNIDGPHTGLPLIPNSKATGFIKADTDSGLGEAGPVIDIATPWKISFIQEGLGGRYDHDTIVEMLRQCRGDIDRAFANLLDDTTSSSNNASPSPATSSGTLSTGPIGHQSGYKPRLPPSRSSSRHSSASKRSANATDDEDVNQYPTRRTRGREQKRRILPNVTVGIAFRDENKNDLVSLRLRVNPDTIAEQANVDSPMKNMALNVDGRVIEGRNLRTYKLPAQIAPDGGTPGQLVAIHPPRLSESMIGKTVEKEVVAPK